MNNTELIAAARAEDDAFGMASHILALCAALEQAERERDALQRFKDWVHAYLDSKGVPNHPPGTHGAAGCRIGDRMDWVMKQQELHSQATKSYYDITVQYKIERDTLKSRIAELEAAIRSHRDQRGDDRCWMDDETLYTVLPEGYTPPVRDSSVELERCQKYITCRHNPATEYVSPQRRIEELEGHLRNLGWRVIPGGLISNVSAT